MLHFFRTAFTSRDNTSTDIGRVLFAFGVVATICLEGWVVIVHSEKFEVGAFAGAISALLVSGGAGLAVKAHTEPPAS